MKKYLIGLGVLAAVGIAYWLISPLFIEERVEEALPLATQPEQEITEVARGSFIGLTGHNAEGTAKVVKIGDQYYVRFEEDFRVTNGPDLVVYFGKDDRYLAEAKLDELKGNVGSQNYLVPAGLNPADYNEVWVWCRAFAVPFGKAELVLR